MPFRHVLCCFLVPGLVVTQASWTSRLDHGSFKGFPTYAEANTLLREWLAKYQHLIENRKIGASLEGRTIFGYVLGARDQTNTKPQMLVTSLMHAREPAGLTVVLYFIGRLLELYEQGDPESVYILENREIWVVPFVNPDGYVMNEQHPNNPIIRKNSRPTCNNVFQRGVDLNRNFATAWEAGFSQGCNEEYRGTAPFSEPETQALKGICDTHKFVAAINFHSYGSILTHPYNYAKSVFTSRLANEDDNKIYYDLHQAFNLTKFGPAVKVLGYTCAGESDDWFYSAKGIISMSPEVGPEDGYFFPNAKEIAGINERNFARTLHLAAKAGLELGVSWRRAPVAVALRGRGGEASAAFDLTLSNTGLSASTGALLHVAVAFTGAPASEVGAVKGNLSVLATGPAGESLPVGLSVSAAEPVATFQVQQLRRRSSSALQLSLVGAWPSESLGSASLCVFEALGGARPGGPGGVCQCHRPAALGAPGVRTDVLAQPAPRQRFVRGALDRAAGTVQRLCAAAEETARGGSAAKLWSSTPTKQAPAAVASMVIRSTPSSSTPTNQVPPPTAGALPREPPLQTSEQQSGAGPVASIVATAVITFLVGLVVVLFVCCAFAKRLNSADKRSATAECTEDEIKPALEKNNSAEDGGHDDSRTIGKPNRFILEM